MTFYGLAAIAFNIRKGGCFLCLYGVRAPAKERVKKLGDSHK